MEMVFQMEWNLEIQNVFGSTIHKILKNQVGRSTSPFLVCFIFYVVNFLQVEVQLKN